MNTKENEKLIVQYYKLLKGSEQGRKHAIYTIVSHTSILEGCTMSDSQILQLLDQDKASSNRSFNDHLMVFDFYNALQFVMNAAKLERPVTPELIRQIAAMVMKNTGKIVLTNMGDYHTANGEYRKMPFRHISRICPDPQLIPRLMISLCDDINREISKAVSLEDKLKSAFHMHIALINLQPFGEGNFRVANLMMNYVLGLYKLPGSMIFRSYEKRFYFLLEQMRKTDKPEPYLRFLNSQMAKLLRLEVRVLSKAV
ncbi:MAG: Fic family protein [Prolixibacteraceae bacterium]|nr:Fic family protein [Prolixibacteraceae bacterium]